jgi:hypothetical protein
MESMDKGAKNPKEKRKAKPEMSREREPVGPQGRERVLLQEIA